MSRRSTAVLAPGRETSAPLRPFSEIPRAGWLEVGRDLIFYQRNHRVEMLSRLDRLYREHGPLVRYQAGPFRLLHLYGPDANRLVLLDRNRIFSARLPWMMIMGRIFPNGLLLRDGREHVAHRKIMHTAFRRPALREYLARMNPMIDASLARWGCLGGDLLGFRAFKELTLDMATAIFVGLDLGPEASRMNAAFEDMVAASMSRIRLRIPGLEFYRGLEGREFMVRYLREQIERKRAGDGRDMFSRLCHAETEEGERFEDQEIIDHMIFLMMAAHDTTTSTLCSMVYELARHPEWQERVREESLALGKDAIGFEDLERLQALTWVMKETLRRYPPLPVIPRVATAEFAFGGYRIPAGAMLVISPIHTHHLPEWWRAPAVFDPARFSPERAEDQRHSHSWIPFGGGPHHCLGFRFAELQIKAIVHQLVCRYRVKVPAGYRMPVQQAPISRPRDGLPLSLERLGRSPTGRALTAHAPRQARAG
jgi:cytochrome P450